MADREHLRQAQEEIIKPQLSAIRSLAAARVTPAHVDAFLHELQAQGVKLGTLRSRLFELLGVISSIAPGVDWSWLRAPTCSADEPRLPPRTREFWITSSWSPLVSGPGLYRRKVEALREALVDEETRGGAFGILRSLIEVVLIRPIEGGCEIEQIGETATWSTSQEAPPTKKPPLVLLGSERKKPVSL